MHCANSNVSCVSAHAHMRGHTMRHPANHVGHNICVTHITPRATYRFCTRNVITQMMCHSVGHIMRTQHMQCASHIARHHVLHDSCSASQSTWHHQHVSTCVSLTCMRITRYIICHVSSSSTLSCIHCMSQVIVRVK